MRGLLSCHSCLWQCLRAVAYRPLLAQPTALVRNRTNPRLVLSSLGRRGYAQDPRNYNYGMPKEYEKDWHAYAHDGAAKNTSEEALDDEADPDEVQRKQMKIKLNGAEKAFNYNEPVSDDERRRLKKELIWLGNDSKKVADHVVKYLLHGEEGKALMTAREMSPRMDCVVAWNHIINYFMRKGFDKLALKVFNEMKKRGQKPDYYTFSLVLIGISNNIDKPQALTNAMAVYYSMAAPNSSKKPTILHTNLFLKVCAKAKAFDQLWAVAGQIPDSGPSAADCATYTIILNALKDESETVLPNEGAADHQRRRDKAIIDSRKIWADVIAKWRAHELTMDEGLVLAMARILLGGSRPRDQDDFFSLVEQTMGIPRLKPRISSEPDPVQQRPTGAFDVPLSGRPKHDIAPGHEFDSLSPPRAIGRWNKPRDYAQPSNITLSQLMDACSKTMAKKAADNYWNILTAQGAYGIEPDEPSIRGYLRVLRAFRCSAEALGLVKTHFVAGRLQITAPIFRIAMSACVRDSNNKKSLEHATELMELMESKLPKADIATVGMYLNRVRDAETAEAWWDGVKRVEPICQNLQSMLSYGKFNGSTTDERQRQDACEVMKRMLSLYAKILDQGGIPPKERSELLQKRLATNDFLRRVEAKDLVKRGHDPTRVKEREREKEQARIGKQRLGQGVRKRERPAFVSRP